ncbi:hypothetical protein [Amycolatopsis sp. cmx-4-61]|uniref:hypothetical protein n=1 Tax=Amycolatopsis sp. cmx-4-61 TaxID=2790937 RepID=UPI00397C3734
MLQFAPEPAVAAGATGQGRRRFNADAYAIYRFPRSSAVGTLGIALFDGIGDNADIALDAAILAAAAVRVAARRDALHGMLTATELIADRTVEIPHHDAVGLVVTIRPDQPAVVASVGDCRAYGFAEGTLTCHTVDATKGNRLRAQEVPEDVASGYDHVPITTVARATPITIAILEIVEPVVLLLSDGVYGRLSAQRIGEIVASHFADPDVCVQALVDAAEAAGAADNATAVVVHRPGFVPTDSTIEGR